MKRLVAIALLLASHLLMAASKVAPDVPGSQSSAVTEVIVRYKTPPTKDDLKQLGPYGQVKRSLDIINGIHIALTPQAIQVIAQNPNVAYISPNRSLKGSLDVTTQTVNANLAWSLGWSGTGVGVAVIDSGVALKQDLTAPGGASRVVYSQSFVTGQDPSDGYGHGTHVAGIIAANGAASTGAYFSRTFKGVAPGANLVSLKVLDQNGAGQESDVIAAIQTAVTLKSTYNIRVINLSLGRPVFESYALDPLCQAVEAAWKAGIVVVVAAGNYGRDNSHGTRGYGTIASPGNDPYVITVGATNARQTASIVDDSIASYSSKGPTLVDHIVKPDIVAPGNSVVSLLASTNCTLYTSSRTQIKNNYYETLGAPKSYSIDYFQLSGTSMATPVVAGAAALLIQKNPSLSPDQVKARLMKTAAKLLPTYSIGIDAITLASFSNQSDIFTVGAGYLDINAALATNDLFTLPALSPTAVYNPTTRTVTTAGGLGGILSNDIIWGDVLVWGSSVFGGRTLAGLDIIWGSDIIWGDSTATGFDIIWGDTINFATPPQAMSEDDSDQ